MKNILSDLPDMHWNSDTESLLRDLGRKFERSLLSAEEVALAIEKEFPLVMNRQVEHLILKALK